MWTRNTLLTGNLSFKAGRRPLSFNFKLKCNLSLSDPPVKVSPFYVECLTLWSRFNTTLPDQVEDVMNEIVWNNKNILVNKISCYYSDLVEVGMHRICDMVKADGSFYTWSDLQLKGLQSKNFLFWHGLIEAISISWKKELKSNTLSHTPPFDPLEFALVLNSAKVSVSEINTKKLYEAQVSDLSENPTAQSRFNEMLPDSELVWEKI